MFHVLIFIGTRPEIIKMAPIIRKIEKNNLKLTLIHSGQHYDYQMSNVFLKELELREINENLEIGSGSHGIQTAKMLESYERCILKYKPDIVLAEGDTNTVVAAGIICIKLNVPFGHVEAGIRSYDMTMPEEINRRFASISAAIHFAPTEQAVLNLYYEGIDPKRIHLTGNTIVDATLEHASLAAKKSKIFEKLNIAKKTDLLVVTTHRPANVDVKENLQQICNALIELKEFTIVFPVHPRTMKRLEEFDLKNNFAKASHIKLLEPLGYLDFLNLMQNASLILTDSGGLQEEAMTLKKPCVTLRTNTERPETVKLGVNYLVGIDNTKIITTVRSLAQSKNIQDKFEQLKNPYGDGKASDRIINLIIEKLTQDNLKFTPPNIQKGSLEYQLIKTEREIAIKEYEKENNAVITMVYNEKGLPQIIPNRIPKGWFMRIQK